MGSMAGDSGEGRGGRRDISSVHVTFDPCRHPPPPGTPHLQMVQAASLPVLERKTMVEHNRTVPGKHFQVSSGSEGGGGKVGVGEGKVRVVE